MTFDFELIRTGCRRPRLTLALAVSASISALGCERALAQQASVTAAPAAPAPNGAASAVAEVVVTAQKRTERLQDVPVAVSTVNAQTLVDENLVTLQDFYSRVPGVTFISNEQSGIAIRGITTGVGTSPTVAILIDGVPYNSSSAYAEGVIPDIDPAALQRIEILRGPQGTLYGASSLGGLINYVTADPDTRRFFGRLEAGGNAVDGGGTGYSGRGTINIPLLDGKAALSVSAYYRTDPPFITRRDPVSDVVDGSASPAGPSSGVTQTNANTAKTYGDRIALFLKPIDRVRIELSAITQREHALNADDVSYTQYQGPRYGPLTYDSTPTQSQDNTRIYDARVNIDAKLFNITSLTGYVENRRPTTSDVTNSLAVLDGPFGLPNNTQFPLVNNSRSDKWSQEVRFSSNPGRLEWLGGVFWTHESNQLLQQVNAVTPSGTLLANLYNGPVPSTFEEVAGFGDLTYHFTSKFDVQVGGRYFYNHQTYDEVDTGLLAEGSLPIHASSHESSGTWLVTPQYKFTPNLQAYLRFASGYRPGGPNTNLPGIPATYASDTVVNYEAGVKGALLNHRLTFDAALFWIDWNNIEVQERDPASQLLFFGNGQSARSRGLELNGEYIPWKGMTVSGNATYTDAELTAPLVGGASADAYAPAGSRLPNVAKYTGNVSAEQTFPLGEVQGFVGGTVTYLGERQAAFAAAQGIARASLPGFTNLDVRGGLRFTDLTVNLYVRNVTNELGIVSGDLTSSTTPALGYTFVVAQPRTFGINIVRTF